jgi:hypothetical protein
MQHESDMKAQVQHVAEEQKEAGAERLLGVADAVHGAAHELERALPQAAGYVHDAASRLEDGASTLRTRSIDDLVDSFGEMARRQPALVLAGATVAGLALSRFLKSSNRNRNT